MKRYWALFLCLVLAAVFLTTGCKGSKADKEEATSGGTLLLAWQSQPPTLDTHITTTHVVRDLARPIFENLVTFDKDFQIVPMLAESFTIEDNGAKITFRLRKGVLFHNGKEMKAEDVVASMTRWQRFGAQKADLGNSTWEAVDDYTVVLHVEKPSFTIMYTLANTMQTSSIMPKEIIDAAPDTGVTEYIGTGPFKLENWQYDSYIHYVKFEDYKPVDSPASGLAGRKEALVDEIYAYFVPDASTRLNAMVTGEYHYCYELPFDSIEQLRAAENLVVDVYPFGFQAVMINTRGLFGDIRYRQALNYAMDKEELLALAFGDPEFWDLEPAFMRKAQVNWYTDAGKENYDVTDRERARQLLKEAGYNGQTVKILSAQDYPYHYNAAIYTKEILEGIGMNVEIDATDWATLVSKRADPKLWDIFHTFWTTNATPLQYPFLYSKANYPGWTNNPEIDRLYEAIKNAPSQEIATARWKELQALIYQDLPVINIGMVYFISTYSKDMVGYVEHMGPIFWNVSLKKK